MTRRVRIGALVAAAVAVAGIAVGPLLHHDLQPPVDRQPPSAAARTPDARRVAAVAAAAGIHALACAPASPPVSPRHPQTGWCGPYTVTRRQTVCASVDRCTVELVGTLTTRAATTPVALTVTVRRHDGAWQVTAVTS